MRPDVEPFYAIGLSRIAHELKAQGRSILHMEFGQTSTGAPRAAIEVAHRVLDTDPMGYWQSPALMKRLVRHYREKYGVVVDPEQVIFTCGASPALVMGLASTFDAGDVVALARPGYVAYRNTLRALHMRPLELACGHAEQFRLSAAQIEAIDPAPAGLIIASPANPTGAIIPGPELARIADVCRERGIRIVSDEIYHGLSYGEPIHSMLEYEPDALIINSFSKYFSMAGWRLGWVVAPPAHVNRARAFMSALFLTSPSLAQHAALAAMDCEAELDGHVEVYRRNRDLLLEALPTLGLNAIAPPDGAFYIYVDVGHLTNDSLAFCERLLRETGVATAPGVDFDPVDGRRFIRLSFAIHTAEVEEAIARLRPWFAAQGAARTRAG